VDPAASGTGRHAARPSRPLTPFGFGWPNVISAFRILFVPAIVWLILGGRPAREVAAALFLIGGATDGVDGYIARRYGAVSRTGQWLDPLADKLLVAAPVLTLAATARFPVWAAAIFLVREAAISILRVVLGLRGIALPASRSAKVKTALQLAAIALYILPLGRSLHAARLGVLVVALAVTVSTGLEYLVRGLGWLGAPAREGEARG
jgi:CDP-diacylglycerol--glycerol-3-phosphate 3-phosphatidyltransferase